MIKPDWPAPRHVRALMTTRSMGDMSAAGRASLRGRVPANPVWLNQVHGTTVLNLDQTNPSLEADAAFTRRAGMVCAVGAADCMPVLLTDEAGTVVAAAHAGWRGLSAGVIEAALLAMKIPPDKVLAWLGPAIGPGAYEVGRDVRVAFAAYGKAFSAPTRPGHWLLDLYAVARERLRRAGVDKVYGGGFCTYSDPERFYSYRRDKTKARMAALIWLT
ncbi:MAG TPA: peptidoglycan editing factor PgeF [Burkholderiales bacterium]|jgi:YfiH family protein